MAYITRMIAHGETLIGVSRIHWIHLVQGLLWLIGLMACGFLLDSAITRFFGLILPTVQFGAAFLETTWLELFFLVAGLFIFGTYFLNFATTEVALTTQRIIHKRGWLFVDVKEVNLEEVKGSHIDLGYLGRFLGYGSIDLDARFVHDAQLPFINKPYRFITAMNEAQGNIEEHFSLAIGDAVPNKVHLTQRQQQTGGEEDPVVPQQQGQSPAPAAQQSEPQQPEAPQSNAQQPAAPTSKKQPNEKRSAPVAAPANANDKAPPSDKSAPEKEEPAVRLAVTPNGTRVEPDSASAPAQEDEQSAQKAPPASDQGAAPADGRPVAGAHEVATGSYEEERLKEELIEEWEEQSDADDTAADKSDDKKAISTGRARSTR